MSTAPSLLPTSSVNFIDILFLAENDLRASDLLAPTDMKLREMLNLDMRVWSIYIAK